MPFFFFFSLSIVDSIQIKMQSIDLKNLEIFLWGEKGFITLHNLFNTNSPSLL